VTGHSQNGWPASRALRTRPLTVDGVTVFIADNDDLETVFRYLLTRYAETVEPLVSGQCGCYSYRANRNNPNQLSNHSSATALDVNWLKHPNNVPTRGTFTVAQVAAVHAIYDSVRELSDLVHWGGDWAPPLVTDAMHHELHSHDLALLARVADRIRDLEDDMPYTEEQLKAIVREAIHEALDAEKVDKAGEVSLRQSANQTRNDAAKAAAK
jgi:hypothetical protein